MRKSNVFLCVALVLGMVVVVQADPINPTDPALRLWLKADAITNARPGQDFFGNPVNYVDAWPDSSSYNTLIARQTTDEAANDPDNHTPQLVTATCNGVSFPAVNFRQAYDPTSPDPGSGFHYADRLYQQSNLNSSGFDPLDIGGGTDLTALIVMNNAVAAGNGALGPWQTVFAKRGPGACPYQLGYGASADQHYLITYDAQTVYWSGLQGVPTVWGLVEMKITGDGSGNETLTFTEWYSDGSKMGASSSQTIPGTRNATVGDDTPFTIGFHAQGAGAVPGWNPWGNGAYERFAGQIAEIIIFGGDQSNVDLPAVENYLLDKYNIPEPLTLTLLGLGVLGLRRRRA